MSSRKIFASTNRIVVLIAILIFVILPFVHSGATMDPEIAPRFFLLSTFLCLLSFHFIINADAIDSSLIKSLVTRREIIFFIFLVLLSAFSLLRSVNTGDGLSSLCRLITMGLLWIILVLVQYKKQKAFYEFIPFVNIAVLIFSFYGVAQVMLAYQGASAASHTFFNPRNITSTLGNHSYYSGTMLLTMPFSIYGILRSKGWLKYLSFVSLLLAFVTIAVLQSAAVILALIFSAAVSICLLLIFQRHFITRVKLQHVKRNVIFMLVIVFLFCTLVFLRSGGFNAVDEQVRLMRMYITHPDVMNVNSNTNDNSVFERLLLWRNSLKLVEEYPAFGCGLADWKVEMPKYRITGNALLNLGQVRFDHPDNDYLLITAERGLVGLLVYLLIFFFVFRKILHAIRSSSDEDQRLLSLLLFFGVLAFMVLSLFENPEERFYPIAFVMIMFASVENKVPVAATRKNHSSLSRIVFSIFFVLMLTAAVVFYKKYASETFLKKAIAAQKEQQWTAMKQNISGARSAVFSFDLLGTPLEWYMGLANYYSGNTEQSFLFYEEAIKKNPYHLQAWNDLGTLYEHEKNHKQAIGCYRRALDLNPYFPQGILNLTAAYFNAGEIDSAYQTIVKHEADYTDASYRSFLLAVLKAKVHTSSSTTTTSPVEQMNYESDSMLLKTFDSCRRAGVEFTLNAMKKNQ